MHDHIRRIAAWLLRPILGPCIGRHRASTPPREPHAAPVHRMDGPQHLPDARSLYGLDHALDGRASALVRPYLVACGHERARQRRRRLALVLAADFGFDLDQHVVGAQGVAV
ncbi:hypothetical protein OG936_13935 [Streptomyces sp. NBC_00846]|uniref:hypothetical protein n=1 Tax=Streptomyces sp. NBC_00846 TaxID=2975849 RepID=UPI003864161D|nr:hypothetical protein OG936_13935 [Streptomyces sp. NBC_00846]